MLGVYLRRLVFLSIWLIFTLKEEVFLTLFQFNRTTVKLIQNVHRPAGQHQSDRFYLAKDSF